MTEESSKNLNEKTRDLIQEKLAGIMIYWLRTCDVLRIDLIECMNKKIKEIPCGWIRWKYIEIQ